MWKGFDVELLDDYISWHGVLTSFCATFNLMRFFNRRVGVDAEPAFPAPGT